MCLIVKIYVSYLKLFEVCALFEIFSYLFRPESHRLGAYRLRVSVCPSVIESFLLNGAGASARFSGFEPHMKGLGVYMCLLIVFLPDSAT